MLMVKATDICLPSDDNEYEELVEFADAMASATTYEAVIIPDNATNGEMIEKLFPNLANSECRVCTDKNEIILLDYKAVKDWWNAPYTRCEGRKDMEPNKTIKVYCTKCPYFTDVVYEGGQWFGARCKKDGHSTMPSMYAIKSLHDRCPLTAENEEKERTV